MVDKVKFIVDYSLDIEDSTDMIDDINNQESVKEYINDVVLYCIKEDITDYAGLVCDVEISNLTVNNVSVEVADNGNLHVKANVKFVLELSGFDEGLFTKAQDVEDYLNMYKEDLFGVRSLSLTAECSV